VAVVVLVTVAEVATEVVDLIRVIAVPALVIEEEEVVETEAEEVVEIEAVVGEEVVEEAGEEVVQRLPSIQSKTIAFLASS